MSQSSPLLFLVATVALVAAGLGRAGAVTAAPDRDTGVYQVGETVRWRIERAGDPAPVSAHYRFLQGGLTVSGEGTVDLGQGNATLKSTFAAPGTMLLEVTWKTASGQDGRATAGAVAAPDHIGLSAPRPADFDSFWQAKLQELAAVPVDPRLTPVAVDQPGVAYWKITLANIRGATIHGQLARPARAGKFPALLIVQWAGVYGLERSWVTGRAAAGWLVLNIEPHDLPIDEPPAFYKAQEATGPVHEYWRIGNDSRETSYYLRMYLSCYRAADYLASRPDWDGRTLVVMGGSQGGQQSLVTAALYPGITAALAVVPAGCDMLGPAVGRKGGWPQWYDNTAGKDPAKVREASRYFDVANFTPDITCPVLVGLGLRDETCPPAGVLAAVNQIKSPKEIILLPRSGHQDEHGSQDAYNRRCNDNWLPALRQGQPAPVNLR